MRVDRWWRWPRRHRRWATLLAVLLTSIALTWVGVRWLFADNKVDRLLDRGDSLASIVSGILAAVGVCLAYLAWRRPVLGPQTAPNRVAEPFRPAQLPADTPLFTGRKIELDTLRRQLASARRRGQVAAVTIDGMAGVGKTALSIRIAHRLARYYPGGQLFIDLHGHSQRVEPIDPSVALSRLLVGLGVEPERIPSDLDEKATLWRSLVASHQVLLVLDNAANEDQVRPLLPGAGGSAALITSRQRLAGVAATHTLSLDMLPPADAATLFVRTVGLHRLPAQESLVNEIVELCGRLPLAIRVAGARLRSRPAWHGSDLLQRLRDQSHRLDELAAGSRSIAAALTLSYRQLSRQAQELYRLLSLHPGADFDARAGAALIGRPLATAQLLCDQLVDAHLLEELKPGRYEFHDLVRAHASVLLAEEPGPPVSVALTRLLSYYRETTAAAVKLLYPDDYDDGPASDGSSVRFGDLASAFYWLDVELSNVLALARYVAGGAEDVEYIFATSSMLRRHLSVRGLLDDAEALHNLALASANTEEHRAVQVDALLGLAHIRRRQGRSEQARADFATALDVARAAEDRTGEFESLLGLSDVDRMRGRYESAASYLRQVREAKADASRRQVNLSLLIGGHIHRLQALYNLALDDFSEVAYSTRAVGDQTGEVGALIGLGWTYLRQGKWESAILSFEQALSISQLAHHSSGEGNSLVGLGWADLRLNQLQQAASRLTHALEISRTIGHRYIELDALAGLGHAYRRQNRRTLSARHYDQALSIAQSIEDRNWHLEVIIGKGRLRQAEGKSDEALILYQEALRMAAELTQPVDQARAHCGIAYIHRARHQSALAREHWQTALALLAGTGSDDTEDEEVNAARITMDLDTVVDQS